MNSLFRFDPKMYRSYKIYKTITHPLKMSPLQTLNISMLATLLLALTHFMKNSMTIKMNLHF